MVPQHSSSKNKKTALLLEDDIFPIDYRFGIYPPINGYGAPGHDAELGSEIPVYLESNWFQVTSFTANDVGVKLPWGVSAIAVDKWSTNNAMLNAWR
ncbi:hypothetical protein MUP38_02385 [Candidatus Bathyarchaeota archaeon]|nr:hypothetical protein [Candidatus Bathyarchaeota archaeon]